MSGKDGFTHLVIVIVGLVLLLLVGLVFLVSKSSSKNNVGGIPFLSKENKTSQVVVGMKSEYDNPFDAKSQYINPFSNYQNPFDNIE